jgi:hypothetical protein
VNWLHGKAGDHRDAARIMPPVAASQPDPLECRRPVELPPIPLSAEHRAILEQPLNPRVARILAELRDEVAEAQRAMDARRVIRFPRAGSMGHVVRDSEGRLTFPSGAPPEIGQTAIL